MRDLFRQIKRARPLQMEDPLSLCRCMLHGNLI